MNSVIGALGLIFRAGKIRTGGDTCKKLIKQKNGYLLLIANDAGSNTQKEFKYQAQCHDLNVFEQFSKEELSSIFGKKNVSVAIVIDEQMSKWLLDLIRK